MSKAVTKSEATPAPEEAPLITYKGFGLNWKCRDFQFDIGQTYVHDGDVVRCTKGGFHSCEYPLDVFAYYAPGDSRYAVVEASGKIDRSHDDTKIASGRITISAEVHIPKLIEAAIKWVTDRCEPTKAKHATGYSSASSSTGYRSASSSTGCSSASSSTGYSSASSSTGDKSASSSTGYKSASSSTGYSSASSSTGYSSASSSTGDRSASSSTGDRSASSSTGCGSASSSTGDKSASSSTGYKSASSSTGYSSASSSTGDQAVAAAFGYVSKARAGKGGTIIVAWWDAKAKRKRVSIGYVGEDGIEADTWYRCDDSGKLVRV